MHTNTLGFQSPPETVSIGTSSAFQTKEGDRSTSSQAGPSIYDCLFPNYLANATDFRLFFFQRTFVHMTNFYVSYCNSSFCSEKKTLVEGNFSLMFLASSCFPPQDNWWRQTPSMS